LAESFRVLTYDRRGHSQSERPPEQGSVREDVADLAALIEHLELGPAWVAGNSFDASITLRLAGERSDLLRGIIAHEPPLFSLLANDPSVALMLDEVGKRIGAVVERIASGDDAGAARQFVETVALGPGSWDQLSPDLKETFITNAPTFLDEAHDPEQLAFDLAWIGAFHRPSLLTTGDQSPPTFAPVVEKVANVLPNASVATFRGAGHIPHVTGRVELGELRHFKPGGWRESPTGAYQAHMHFLQSPDGSPKRCAAEGSHALKAEATRSPHRTVRPCVI
jgi:pimeloyl-ACP methyl ester carboxylesterase